MSSYIIGAIWNRPIIWVDRTTASHIGGVVSHRADEFAFSGLWPEARRVWSLHCGWSWALRPLRWLTAIPTPRALHSVHLTTTSVVMSNGEAASLSNNREMVDEIMHSLSTLPFKDPSGEPRKYLQRTPVLSDGLTHNQVRSSALPITWPVWCNRVQLNINQLSLFRSCVRILY